MTLDELLKQKADLDRQIAQYQNEGRAKAIADIQVLMAQHGLTAADLVAPARKGPKPSSDGSRKPVAAKYKDGSGNAWSGRGLKPKWLTAALASGKTLADFHV
jgi:DNA-binding protein H-NS